MSDPSESEGGQSREIGAIGSLTTVAGSMLGVGIFIVPPVVAGQLPATGAFFSVWIAAALAAASGAVAYAHLGIRYPRAGGDYVFQRHAYGRAVAFASGWVLFGGIFTGSVAALAVPLCRHQIPTLLQAVWPGIEAGWETQVAGLAPPQWLALLLVAAITAWNSLRARLSATIQTLTTVVPIVGLTIGAIYLLVAVEPAVTVPAPEPPGSAGAWVGSWVDAYVAVYFAYSGWNAVIYVAGEVDEPESSLPIGLVGGTALVTVVYLVLCATYVSVLGFGALAEAGEAGSAVAGAVGGEPARLGVAALIAVAMLASLNATVLGGGRVAYAMARDGSFVDWFDSTNEHGVPVRALWAQAAIASLLVVTGTFEEILELVGLAMMFVGTMTVVAVWVLRASDDGKATGLPSWGAGWFPAIYVVSSAVVVVYELVQGFQFEAWSDIYPLVGLVVFGVALVAGFWRER